MDADEFFNSFMDKIENQLKDTRYEHLIKNSFGGKLTNEIISKDC